MLRFKIKMSEKVQWFLRAVFFIQVGSIVYLLSQQYTGKQLAYYKELNTSIKTTNMAINEKIDWMNQGLEKMVKKRREGVAYINAAKQVRGDASELIKNIERLEEELFIQKEKLDVERFSLFKKQFNQFSDRTILVNGEAERLEVAFQKLDEAFQHTVKGALILPENATIEDLPVAMMEEKELCGVKEQGWVACLFDGLPYDATLALLQKLKLDITLSEYTLIDMLCGHFPKAKPKQHIYEPKVVPNTRVLYAGETLEADIFLAHRRADLLPARINLNNTILNTDETGKAHYVSPPANKTGTFSLDISITTSTGTGQTKTYAKNVEYKVMERCR